MFVLERNGALINFLVRQRYLFLLYLLFVEVLVGLDDVVLGELTKGLELVHEAILAFHKLLLLLHLAP
jgi:hypothetical protein